jgi:hypothetical protein
MVVARAGVQARRIRRVLGVMQGVVDGYVRAIAIPRQRGIGIRIGLGNAIALVHTETIGADGDCCARNGVCIDVDAVCYAAVHSGRDVHATRAAQ